VTQYETEPSGWASGGMAFAAVMMIIIGIYQVLAGISAISKDDVFVVSENYVFDIDIAAWGWIHLLLGILVILGGLALIAGKVWGGMLGIALATLSAIANFFLIPYYPIWSIVVIALAVWIIWALTRPEIYRAA
jgi:hypothetical protein